MGSSGLFGILILLLDCSRRVFIIYAISSSDNCCCSSTPSTSLNAPNTSELMETTHRPNSPSTRHRPFPRSSTMTFPRLSCTAHNCLLVLLSIFLSSTAFVQCLICPSSSSHCFPQCGQMLPSRAKPIVYAFVTGVKIMSGSNLRLLVLVSLLNTCRRRVVLRGRCGGKCPLNSRYPAKNTMRKL